MAFATASFSVHKAEKVRAAVPEASRSRDSPSVRQSRATVLTSTKRLIRSASTPTSRTQDRAHATRPEVWVRLKLGTWEAQARYGLPWASRASGTWVRLDLRSTAPSSA